MVIHGDIVEALAAMIQATAQQSSELTTLARTNARQMAIHMATAKKLARTRRQIPLLKKGGRHGKTNKAKRKAEKQQGYGLESS